MKALGRLLRQAWPARRGVGRRRGLAFRFTPLLMAWVKLEGPPGPQLPQALRHGGCLHRTTESDEEWLGRAADVLRGAAPIFALLEADQYQVYKLPAPNVPRDELKAAARWQVKELVQGRLEDMTLDVLQVGGEVERANKELFVITAPNPAIQSLIACAEHLGLTLDAIDIWETSMRNLQSAQAHQDGLNARATAALLVGPTQCVLTVSAAGELCYTRRLDADPRLLERAEGKATHKPSPEAPLGLEYMPGDAFSFGDSPAEESTLIIELQRSIDVWERSWPDLPLACLYLISSESTGALATLMQRELGLKTSPLELGGLFSGLNVQNNDDLRECLPLLGLCLREDLPPA